MLDFEQIFSSDFLSLLHLSGSQSPSASLWHSLIPHAETFEIFQIFCSEKLSRIIIETNIDSNTVHPK